MRTPRAFTLLEVILVLGIVAMLAGSIFGFMWNLLSYRDVLAREARQSQAGNSVIERIESDVLCGLAGDAGKGAGVAGSANRLKLLTRGVGIPADQDDRAAVAGDLQASEYEFDAGTGVLKARRWNLTGKGQPPEFDVVSDHVQGLRLRYFDGKEWVESFDSLAGNGLPVAIEIAMWFGEPLPRTEGAEPPAAPARTDPISDTRRPAAARGAARTSEPGREPDRLRIIVVPDGPVTSWKEGR